VTTEPRRLNASAASDRPDQREAPAPPPAQLEAVIERITYQSEETGYTVARVVDNRNRLITVVGNLLGATPGESVRLEGRWTVHPKHGRQFEVQRFRLTLPATAHGVEKYLGSGLVRGVGPVSAKRIVEHLGAETLEIIDSHPERLLDVPGIGPVRLRAITSAWAEQRSIREVMVALQDVGVSPALGVRIYKRYGDLALNVVQNEPYRLAREVWGIGFKTADKVAREQGVAYDAPSRVAAGVRYALSQAADEEGHCYLPREELGERARELLGVEQEAIDRAVDELMITEEVLVETLEDGSEAIYLAPFRHAEVGVAHRVRLLRDARLDRLAEFATVDWDRALDWLRGETGLELAPEQRAAVVTALTQKVSILTGGPGTGKSTTVRSVVELARAKRKRVLLLAPTGRAAKRLAELAHAPAHTIHRFLKLRPGAQAAFNETQPLEADLVVIDETSMLDLILANTLFKAIAPGTHVLLVGDTDQLPSVGPGSVLADLIKSEAVPVIRLERIFRQAESSQIVQNAHRINRGEPLPWTNRPDGDCFVFTARTPEAAADLVVEIVRDRIPRRFGIPPSDILVLSPMHKGLAGVGLLNERLQEALNPPGPGRAEVRAAGRLFRVGDRVIMTQNDYEREVFNGDFGTVVAVDHEARALRLAMDDGREVTFDFLELDELQLAYALTIHKAQGSEFRACVLVLLTSHYVMLARNLLYTALTRARRLAVLVGQPAAAAIAVRNDRVARRYTGLARRLAGSPRDGSRGVPLAEAVSRAESTSAGVTYEPIPRRTRPRPRLPEPIEATLAHGEAEPAAGPGAP